MIYSDWAYTFVPINFVPVSINSSAHYSGGTEYSNVLANFLHINNLYNTASVYTEKHSSAVIDNLAMTSRLIHWRLKVKMIKFRVATSISMLSMFSISMFSYEESNKSFPVCIWISFNWSRKIGFVYRGGCLPDLESDPSKLSMRVLITVEIIKNPKI